MFLCCGILVSPACLLFCTVYFQKGLHTVKTDCINVKMASQLYTEEQLNFFRICCIATDILPQGLRSIFKQEWDSRYKATLGEWKDTPKNGQDFKNGESPANQRRHARLLATMINGDRAEWDSTILFYAILHSDSIAALSQSGGLLERK